MTLSDWANIATTVTAAAVIVAILSFIGDRSQRHREFESLYVQRYWAIHDRQPASVRLGSHGRPGKADRALALDYLRLCEDELEIRKLGLVTNRLQYIRQFARDHSDPYKGWSHWAKWNGL